jgi:hypothetical protein
MKKKIDIDLIIAFIDKKLDKETTKEVRSYIDNDNEWFLEYISLKQADYEIKSEELGDVEIGELSHSLASDASKAYSKKKDSIPFIKNLGGNWSMSPAFAERISVGMISLLLIGTFIATSMFTSLSKEIATGGGYRSYDGAYTSLNFSEDDKSWTLSSTYPDKLNVAITLPSLIENPSFEYYDFDALFFKINSQDKISFSYLNIIDHYNLDSNIASSPINFRVTIYTDSQEEVFNKIINYEEIID